jgi:transcription-repair coupling factor (superfamily II helicase)
VSPNFVEIISKRLNTAFLKSKLGALDKEPLVLKNIPINLLSFTGELLNNVVERSFDIVIVKNQEEIEKVFEEYKEGNIERFFCKVGEKFSLDILKNFNRVKRVWSKGEYSILGDILILWPLNHSQPLRISLFDNVVESIDIVEKSSFQKIESLESFEIISHEDVEFLTYNKKGDRYKYPILFFDNRYYQMDNDWEVLDLGFKDIPGLDHYLNNKSVLLKILDDYLARGYQIICSTKDVNGVQNLLNSKDFTLTFYDLEKGFVAPELKILVLSDYELFGKISLEKSEYLKQILPGDFVVHEDHGIGIFEKIVENEKDTYIEIRYANKDKLLVPLSQSDKITKYIGGRGRIPVLTTLNSGTWGRAKKKVKVDAEDLAKKLLQIYAMREVLEFKLDVEKEFLEKELEKFVKDFQFKDTHDQSLVTQEIFEDISSGKLMDRLLVGDVGFGKTEMAMRAIFLVASMGMQAMLLAPTTILVEQHSAVFKDRLGKYGLRVESLSRFLSLAEKKEILKRLKDGQVDVIIGTHSLLYDGVQFKDLGLMVIDEEQKFGVKQKEKLKQKRLEAHVLSMSATPIPRSLSMSLSGIRDISTLFTPPEGRKSIVNKFAPFDWSLVREAVEKEVARNGQIYFLQKRVFDIPFTQKKLQKLFPKLNIGVLHGQMGGDDIARVMSAFCSNKIDILICTTIIENGLDIPNVNTLIVADSSNFGLAQLYQIRGRIGRSKSQAYAHFLYKSMKGNAELRLDALMEAQELGSGFLLANRDLEIRGAGDLLGKAQSGSINSVGYALFMKYLSEAVENLRKRNC